MISLVLIYLVSFLSHQASASCDVEMVSREEWGAREPRNTEIMTMPVPHIFIHHTATPSCSNLQTCSAMMKSMQNYHMDTNGWNDIGYNFVIGGDGRAYVGRGWDKVGAHTYGYNYNAIALSLIGNYVRNAPPEDMLTTAKKMIECAKNNNYVTDNYKIHGHRDASCTECPGQALYDIIKTWDRFEGGPLPTYTCKSG